MMMSSTTWGKPALAMWKLRPEYCVGVQLLVPQLPNWNERGAAEDSQAAVSFKLSCPCSYSNGTDLCIGSVGLGRLCRVCSGPPDVSKPQPEPYS